jgi:uncharacterized protein YjiS (DUF1127 family)
MTTYDDRPATTVKWLDAPARHVWCRLGRSLRTGLKHVQYAQMVSVLNRLPDVYLKEAGLRRCDISEHARRSIFGKH